MLKHSEFLSQELLEFNLPLSKTYMSHFILLLFISSENFHVNIFDDFMSHGDFVYFSFLYTDFLILVDGYFHEICFVTFFLSLLLQFCYVICNLCPVLILQKLIFTVTSELLVSKRSKHVLHFNFFFNLKA